MNNSNRGNHLIALFLLLVFMGIPSMLNAAMLKIVNNCSAAEESYNAFKIREMSFRNDNGNPSIRVYAWNKEKKAGFNWNPKEWGTTKVVKIKDELPADVVIRFEKGQALEALTMYSTLSSLFQSSKLDAVRVCGGTVDTAIDEAISLTIQWGKEGSVRFW